MGGGGKAGGGKDFTLTPARCGGELELVFEFEVSEGTEGGGGGGGGGQAGSESTRFKALRKKHTS